MGIRQIGTKRGKPTQIVGRLKMEVLSGGAKKRKGLGEVGKMMVRCTQTDHDMDGEEEYRIRGGMEGETGWLMIAYLRSTGMVVMKRMDFMALNTSMSQ